MSDKIVPEYDSRNIFVRSLFLKRLNLSVDLFRKVFEQKKIVNVADFGCGDGILLGFLEKKFKDIKTFGLDILPEVSSLRSFLRADIRIVNLTNSGFPSDFFDAIFCLDTLEHFENLEEPIKEIERTLKNHGILIVSLPTENVVYKIGRFILKGTFSSKKGPSSSPHFHNADEIRKFLLKNSFTLVKKEKVTKIPFLKFFEIILFKKDVL